MGTTVTAAFLDDSTVAIAHVGDSRAYMFRDGELVRLTQDHSLVDELVRRGKLTEEQALEHPQRSIITRALGPEPVVEVDTWTYAVRAGDIFMLCSDGLTSMVSERRIKEIMAASESLHHTADSLIDMANEAGGRDNITVILFRIEEVGGDAVEAPTMVGLPIPEEAGGTGSDAPDEQEQHDAEEEHAGASAGARVGDVIGALDPGGGPRGRGRTMTAPPRTRTQTARRSAHAEAAVRPVPAPVQPAGGRRARLARTQGHAPPQRERHFGRLGKAVAALIATATVVFLFGAGGYLASRQLYFLGTDSEGIVTVYRGFPYDLPFGIKLYETFYVSGVPASLIPADRRTTLLNHDLRSQSAATKLINDLELGRVSR
jgi:protein phosphatase